MKCDSDAFDELISPNPYLAYIAPEFYVYERKYFPNLNSNRAKICEFTHLR